MKGGLLNILGFYTHLISFENDDRVALRNARLMASITALRCLCSSREIESLSTKSYDLSLDQREPG